MKYGASITLPITLRPYEIAKVSVWVEEETSEPSDNPAEVVKKMQQFVRQRALEEACKLKEMTETEEAE
jgi:hypothetical protein